VVAGDGRAGDQSAVRSGQRVGDRGARTALDDLLEIEDGKINDTRLYRCLDRILPYKTKLEQHLKQRYGELFGAEFDVLLYDLTSTYVEGAAEKNPMMRRGTRATTARTANRW
jgi:hypothetical protein